MTTIALGYNDDSGHRHMHYIKAFNGRDPLAERGNSSLGRLLGTLGEHPSVARVGWDVLLTALSVAVWAGVKGSQKRVMLSTLRPSGNAGSVRDLKTKEDRTRQRSSAAIIPESLLGRRISLKKKGRKGIGESDGTLEVIEPVETLEGNVWAQKMGDDEKDADWESTGLALGLSILGGLGAGSASVFAAEVGP